MGLVLTSQDFERIGGIVNMVATEIRELRKTIDRVFNLRTFWTVKLFNKTVLTVEGTLHEIQSVPPK